MNHNLEINTFSLNSSLKASMASFLSLNTIFGSGVLFLLVGAEPLLELLSSSVETTEKNK